MRKGCCSGRSIQATAVQLDVDLSACRVAEAFAVCTLARYFRVSAKIEIAIGIEIGYAKVLRASISISLPNPILGLNFYNTRKQGISERCRAPWGGVMPVIIGTD